MESASPFHPISVRGQIEQMQRHNTSFTSVFREQSRLWYYKYVPKSALAIILILKQKKAVDLKVISSCLKMQASHKLVP